MRKGFLLAGAAGAIALFLALIPGHRGWFDVGVYYGTVHYWADGGQLYDYVKPNSPYGFTYPPFAALCMLPMTLVGWHMAVAISVALTVAVSVGLLAWWAGPWIREKGWFAFGVGACLFALLEPVRDTVSFGQVNLLLVALVFTDAWLLSTGRSRYAGIGVGLAAAIKLTPAIFIAYLALTRQWRQAAVATGTAAAATLLAGLLAPQASQAFWADAIWDTNRIGSLSYVSNQSLRGVVARVHSGQWGGLIWLVLVVAVVWVWLRRLPSGAPEEQLRGFAVTGLVSCLISPITWVHHLVWAIPAVVVLGRQGGRRLVAAGLCYLLLCSSVVWLWANAPYGLFGYPGGFLGGNAYVWICLGLLVTLRAKASPEGSDRVELQFLRPRLPDRGAEAGQRHEHVGAAGH